MSKKLTPWFVDGSVPAREGVYNVSCRKRAQSGDWYARWDGATWYCAHQSVWSALHEGRAAERHRLWSEEGSWRGLAKKP